MKNTEQIFVVSAPFGEVKKNLDAGRGFFQQRIVDGPHFTTCNAKESQKQISHRLGLECQLIRLKPERIKKNPDDEDCKKFRIVWPQPPDNWVSASPLTK